MRSKAILVALLAFAFVAQAAPVSERQAKLAARAWAAASERFGTRLGSSVEKVREFSLTNGASFFSVKMKGGGAVIVSGDNEDSPIVAMSSADISNRFFSNENSATSNNSQQQNHFQITLCSRRNINYTTNNQVFS